MRRLQNKSHAWMNVKIMLLIFYCERYSQGFNIHNSLYGFSTGARLQAQCPHTGIFLQFPVLLNHGYFVSLYILFLYVLLQSTYCVPRIILTEGVRSHQIYKWNSMIFFFVIQFCYLHDISNIFNTFSNKS